MPKKSVLIEMNMGKGFATKCRMGNYTLSMDQPEAAGGTDTGPTPLQYFLLSLGGCIAAISRIIAKQRNIRLDSITIKAEGELDTDVLMGRNREDRAGFAGITLYVSLDADLSSEEKKAFLAEVDARCPISDNTAHPTPLSLLLQE